MFHHVTQDIESAVQSGVSTPSFYFKVFHVVPFKQGGVRDPGDTQPHELLNLFKCITSECLIEVRLGEISRHRSRFV